jgi:hypothetical protein
MNIGKLYQAKEYFWFLYPSKDIAAATVAFGPATTHRPGANAFWSKQFNCKVSYIFPKSIFCFLEQNEKFIKILSTNGELGWINLSDWWKEDIEEVTV